MSEQTSDEEMMEFTRQCLRAAGERLIEAGWARWALATNAGAGIALTEKGREGMAQLQHAMRELSPTTMQQEHVLGLWQYMVTPTENAAGEG